MKVTRAADRRLEPAGTETFTGEVWMATNFVADGPGSFNSHDVRFARSARTHWHSHPDGQVLIVTEGRGRTQVAGGDPARSPRVMRSLCRPVSSTGMVPTPIRP
jgi:quercetin dioxygenase-like cupin family protein